MHLDKKLFQFSLAGLLFVTIVGTLMHFVYDWSGQNSFVALFAPVNESVWEHMKLLFFPMLVFQIYQYAKLGEEYPRILCGGLYATILGTFSIPILFYGYEKIFGKSNFAVDISIFLLSVLIGMIFNYLLADVCKGEWCQKLSLLLTAFLTIAFFLFTFFPPEGVLFQIP